MPYDYLLKSGITETVNNRERGVNDMKPPCGKIECGCTFVEDQFQF